MYKSPPKLLLAVLAIGSLCAGFFAPTSRAQQQCRREQASCSYTVTNTYCEWSSCSSCQIRCCYHESGVCNDDPEIQGYSTICGGTCGQWDTE
jgi:hypothetical protein